MKKNLPGVFVNKIEKNFNNNKKYFVSNSKISENTTTNNVDINKKIKEIFSSPKYVYKLNVKIKTKNGTYLKKIIGKNGNNLITLDNELINIDSILDINFDEENQEFNS